MTDLRPYFTQIIGHNSVNAHRIPTKVGTQIRLNEPFTCAKFQPDPSTHSCFMADFANVRNEEVEEEEEKNEEIKTKKLKRNFVRSYLGNNWSDFLQSWCVDSPYWPAPL